MHRYKLLIVFLIISLSTACKKYLDIEPKGKVILKTFSDFDLLLNSRSLTSSGDSYLNLMSDEVDNPGIKPEDLSINTLSYLWADQLVPDAGKPAAIWTSTYSNIYIYNAVINKVEDATTGTLEEKKRLKAEALLGRAFEYLYLVNMYGKPYQKATADADFAIPLMTATDITFKTPPRATVNFIYNQLITDINSAIPDLIKGNNPNKFRGSVNAAYSILARIYLYKADYSEAARYADLALSDPANGLLDLNTFASVSDIPGMTSSKQEIFIRYGTEPAQSLSVDIAFLKTFSEGDLRLKTYYTNSTDRKIPIEKIDFGKLKRGDIQFRRDGAPTASFGTSVAEMKLIIAETAARTGNLTLAVKQLNELRIFRINSKFYKAFQSSDQEEVLQQVLLERRHELACAGFRWIDMRRLDLENRMPAITRLDINGNVIATLPQHSTKYTLKIPASVLSFNPDMPQNP
ncbi:hypothetical protein TH53_12240 [Pedobacter lusitanus]|uniref:Uncharacterized protein n=1 Tax=Pedobacter lusitanus TaxID=1503925 RepID=A0A0D0GL71_9SPHI|nr:hypothetical protein TH53_12240 [Pedobacter lusitanus]